jgi:hypothetical protein
MYFLKYETHKEALAAIEGKNKYGLIPKFTKNSELERNFVSTVTKESARVFCQHAELC